MTACVSMLLKSRASLTCFRDCFLPDRAKDLPAPQYIIFKSAVCTWHCTDDQANKNEMGWVCGAYGRQERCVQGFGVQS